MASASDCWFCAKAAAGKAAATASAIDGRIEYMISSPSGAVRPRQARARTRRRNFETAASIPCTHTGEKAPKGVFTTVAELPQFGSNLALSLDKCLTIV